MPEDGGRNFNDVACQPRERERALQRGDGGARQAGEMRLQDDGDRNGCIAMPVTRTDQRRERGAGARERSADA